MAPVHDTDLAPDQAKERWLRSEWQNYELWEEIEVRLRRRKWLWIGGTALVFLIFSAVPTVLDRAPRWACMGANRRLAQEINRIKRAVAVEHQAFRLRVQPDLSYRVERAPTCAEGVPDSSWTPAGEGRLLESSAYALVSPEIGGKLGIPGLVTGVCYDPKLGSDLGGTDGKSVKGLAIAPVKDLTEGRTDRISILLVHGISAEISFD